VSGVASGQPSTDSISAGDQEAPGLQPPQGQLGEQPGSEPPSSPGPYRYIANAPPEGVARTRLTAVDERDDSGGRRALLQWMTAPGC